MKGFPIFRINEMLCGSCFVNPEEDVTFTKKKFLLNKKWHQDFYCLFWMHIPALRAFGRY